MIQPNIKSERLLLRPFLQKDSAALVKICNDPLIAKNTTQIPYPYTAEDSRLFLKRITEGALMDKIAGFAITHLETQELMGAIGLTFEPSHDRAEVGYYLGSQWREKGFATEALKAVIKYGFEFRNLNKICAHVFAYNPASANVLEKAGMKREGILKNHYKKNGNYEDQWFYGIINETRNNSINLQE